MKGKVKNAVILAGIVAVILAGGVLFLRDQQRLTSLSGATNSPAEIGFTAVSAAPDGEDTSPDETSAADFGATVENKQITWFGETLESDGLAWSVTASDTRAGRLDEIPAEARGGAAENRVAFVELRIQNSRKEDVTLDAPHLYDVGCGELMTVADLLWCREGALTVSPGEEREFHLYFLLDRPNTDPEDVSGLLVPRAEPTRTISPDSKFLEIRNVWPLLEELGRSLPTQLTDFTTLIVPDEFYIPASQSVRMGGYEFCFLGWRFLGDLEDDPAYAEEYLRRGKDELLRSSGADFFEFRVEVSCYEEPARPFCVPALRLKPMANRCAHGMAAGEIYFVDGEPPADSDDDLDYVSMEPGESHIFTLVGVNDAMPRWEEIDAFALCLNPFEAGYRDGQRLEDKLHLVIPFDGGTEGEGP